MQNFKIWLCKNYYSNVKKCKKLFVFSIVDAYITIVYIIGKISWQNNL